MNQSQLQKIFEQYHELLEEFDSREQEANGLASLKSLTHNQWLFDNVEDANHHKEIKDQMNELVTDMRKLALSAYREGMPVDVYILVDSPLFWTPSDQKFAIKLEYVGDDQWAFRLLTPDQLEENAV